MIQSFQKSLTFPRECLPSICTAVLFLVVLFLFIVPVPPGILDLLLGFNLGFAVLLLLRAIFIRRISELYSFPALLLFSTLFRLALNVSSTRLILSSGDTGLAAAGEIIGGLGKYAVGQNFFVGLVLFVIIALVNFLVIAKGSARVAEVAARFSLDSLPGRQAEIEHAQRDGAISKSEAKDRREQLSSESKFLGSMDGAMKFVQGDAIAGLIIALLNSFGGVGVGIYKGLGVSESISLYGVLTVGDGLISVIPSLLVAVAAGLVVTHTNDGNRNQATFNLVEVPLVSSIGAISILLLGFLPGFPLLPFFLCAVAFGLFAYFINSKDSKHESSEEIEVYLSESEYESWSESLVQAYERCSESRTFDFPSLAIKCDARLARESFVVRAATGIEKSGEAIDTSIYCVTDAATVELFGGRVVREITDPIQKLPGTWILYDRGISASLSRIGIEIFTPSQYVGRFVSGFVVDNYESFWGLGELKSLVEKLRGKHSALVEEVFDRELVTFPEYAELTRRLVSDGLKLRDHRIVLQATAEYSCLHQRDDDPAEWINGLHSYVRKCLGFRLLVNAGSSDKKFLLFSLSEPLDQKLRGLLPSWYSNREAVPMSPIVQNDLRAVLSEKLLPILRTGNAPVVLAVDGSVRELLQNCISHFQDLGNSIRVLSVDEVVSGDTVLYVGDI